MEIPWWNGVGWINAAARALESMFSRVPSCFYWRRASRALLICFVICYSHKAQDWLENDSRARLPVVEVKGMGVLKTRAFECLDVWKFPFYVTSILKSDASLPLFGRLYNSLLDLGLVHILIMDIRWITVSYDLGWTWEDVEDMDM